jgi:sulfide:quinone oxidoreductase
LGIKTLAAASFSTSNQLGKEHYKLVVVGGGAGGAATQAKFGSTLGKEKVAVIEPAKTHRYQAAWTMVGGGLKNYEASMRPQETILTQSTWIPHHAETIQPDKNLVTTKEGKEIEYDYLVIATGIQSRYDLIKGLPEAFERPEVVSNYHPEYVKKTFPAIQNIQEGTALFTFPAGPLKCAGAPQKIAYIADSHFRNMGKRDKINMIYNTALGKIFSSPKYAEALEKVAEEKGITVNYETNLIEVKPDQKEAVFEILKDGKRVDTKTFPYTMIHISPPHAPASFITNCKELVNEQGFVTVDKGTLQHTKYPNVFSLGDASDLPTSKTAAAVASQCGIIRKNLTAAMDNQPLLAQYNGYTSCPLLTGLDKVMLAEFDYTLEPLETFPMDQRKPRRIMFHVKRDVMPQIYWHGLVKGIWEGPSMFRKIFHWN